ncbi:MAG: exodeoxyribonuclease VII small subunit [Clostridia bacterium]|nr:exodeoxyribonuclease VII small subunit [Clostridia bacterium]
MEINMENENIEELSFEEAMKQLQSLVSDLESGNAPLDKSLELFEKGVALVKHCNEKLDRAEQKVKFLTEGGGETNG